MNAALPLSLGALALAACTAPQAPEAAPVVAGYAASKGEMGALVVTRKARAFDYSEGAEARRAADALCGGRVNSSPEDNFQGGAWVFPGGCA
ncbi:hypothetical protein [Paenirhodobacter hankyongi]|uniref:DUF4189 domain-containing protein n=1 Tax=Paenirhodobacter hankyongi TaxID=2294033 RepID=A0A421BU95_9RHOB|nr:hypothetical protein [Sinirhodobacter hankyongi]RLL71880.1 hypothetical protein DYS74_04515 [Sinirhodobacter hankyongi]